VRSPEESAEMIRRADVCVDGPTGARDLLVALRDELRPPDPT